LHESAQKVPQVARGARGGRARSTVLGEIHCAACRSIACTPSPVLCTWSSSSVSPQYRMKSNARNQIMVETEKLVSGAREAENVWELMPSPLSSQATKDMANMVIALGGSRHAQYQDAPPSVCTPTKNPSAHTHTHIDRPRCVNAGSVNTKPPRLHRTLAPKQSRSPSRKRWVQFKCTYMHANHAHAHAQPFAVKKSRLP
jgi:hypothetical protein